MVPNGMFIKLSADSTIVRMRAHGRNFSRPMPANDPRQRQQHMKTPRAAPVKPSTGSAIQASGSEAAPATPITLEQRHQAEPEQAAEDPEDDVEPGENLHMGIHWVLLS